MEIININTTIVTPVYKQIINSVNEAIISGILREGDLLPSVNQIAGEFSLARGSVFTAYNKMRASGIIDSIPGKGYFVASTKVQQEQNILLLFSTFTPYKEVLYNSLMENLTRRCNVDIFFHHHNIKLFESLIKEQAAYYNTFVIMPEIHNKTEQILSILDQRRVYLIDVGLKEYGKLFPGVCQNFEKDIYKILKENSQLFQKYERLILIFPANNKSIGITKGFRKFSAESKIPTSIITSIKNHNIKKGECYITIEDNDLVHIIREKRNKKLSLGQDIGVISYNESELKSVIGDGITTITTDFKHMGKRIAEMILSGESLIEENPFLLVNRNSA